MKHEPSKKTGYGEMSKKLIPDQLMPRHLQKSNFHEWNEASNVIVPGLNSITTNCQ